MDTPEQTCPRCDYDLSGIMQSWERSCPLTGVCSECGLSFAWRDVISGPLAFPRWSFEHALPGKRWRSFVGTLARVGRPGRLWSSLRLEMETDWARLIVLAMLGPLFWRAAGLVMLGGGALSLVVLDNGWRYLVTQWDWDLVLDLAWPYGSLGHWWRNDRALEPWFVVTVLSVLLTPLAFFLLPLSMRRARVSARHIVRVGAYSVASLPWMAGAWSFMHAADLLTYQTRWEPLELIGDDSTEGFRVRTALIAIAWTGVVLVVFWHAAVRHYLRMEHPRAVAVSMVGVGVLVSTLLVVGAFGHNLF